MGCKSYKVAVPGSLMLFGEHAVLYGKPCIVTAVDQRIYLKAGKVDGETITVLAPQVGVEKFTIKISDLGKVEYPKGVRFLLKAVELFFKKHKVESGLYLETKSQFSSLFGFGSSSAVTVCAIKALSKLFDIEVDNKSLFDIAYQTVLEVQGVGSGFDLAAAIWGGTIYFVNGGEKIEPIETSVLPLIVGYSGIKADTATLVKRVANIRMKDRENTDKIFSSIEKVVKRAKSALENTNYLELGELMDKNHRLLQKLSVSTPRLDNLVASAKEAGALGAKLSGAGGGDCMIALGTKKPVRKIKNAITEAGGTILNVKFNAEGVRITCDKSKKNES